MSRIQQSVDLLDKWIEKNGWAGYDPYDIKGKKAILLLQKNKFTNFSSNFALNRFPIFQAFYSEVELVLLIKV